MFEGIKNLFGGTKGSAFERVANAESAINNAKGKLVALTKTFEAHQQEISELEDGAKTAHKALDQIESRLKNLDAIL